MNNNNTLPERKRKREYLTATELSAFKKIVKSFPTKTDAMQVIGFNHVTLNNILEKGYASPESIKKVRFALNRIN